MAPSTSGSIVVAVGRARIGVQIDDDALHRLFTSNFSSLFSDDPPELNVSIGTASDGRHSLMIGDDEGYSGTDPTNVLDHLVSWFNIQAVTSRPAFINLHAAGVVAPGAEKAVVLPAPPGSGKTTLAAAACARGWGYLSDEVVSLDNEGRLHSYLKPLTVKAGTVPLIDADYAGRTLSDRQTRWYVSPTELGGSLVANALPGVLVFASYNPDSATKATTMSVAEAVLELAINCQDELDADGDALLALAQLATRCHRFRLQQRDVGGAVAALADAAALPPPDPVEVAPLPAVDVTADAHRGPRVGPRVVGVVAPDGVVVHDPGTRSVAVLDPLAGAIWQLLDGTTTESQLVDELATAFNHSRPVVEADVAKLLHTLRDRGFVS